MKIKDRYEAKIPKDKALISKSESIFSIIFSSVIIMILYFSPQYLGAFIRNNDSGYTIIPFFNIEVLNGYMFLLFGVFLTTIIKEMIKIIVGRWNLLLSLCVTALNIAGLLMILTIFLNTEILNSSFLAEILNSTNLQLDTTTAWNTITIWNIITKWFIVIFAAGYIIDTVAVLYKGVKYSNN